MIFIKKERSRLGKTGFDKQQNFYECLLKSKVWKPRRVVLFRDPLVSEHFGSPTQAVIQLKKNYFAIASEKPFASTIN